ncbi:hypothetical protein GCM10018773_45840 [Streptomyces candidus]|nr:hypothetical protein GCM10018773_45840 [Streptomyces candidus]
MRSRGELPEGPGSDRERSRRVPQRSPAPEPGAGGGQDRGRSVRDPSRARPRTSEGRQREPQGHRNALSSSRDVRQPPPAPGRQTAPIRHCTQEFAMADLAFVATTIAVFALVALIAKGVTKL